MYLHFFNMSNHHKPGAVVIGPCFLSITRGILRISPDGDEEGAAVRMERGQYIVARKVFSDIETLESLYFAPADCQILTAKQFNDQEQALVEFTAHGVYTISNACSCDIELSSDGDSARIRYDSGEISQEVTDWLPIESVPAETENFEYTLPNWCLSAVVNDDRTALTDEDEEKLNAFLSEIVEEHGNAHFIVGTDLGFCYKNDIDNLGDDCTQCFICPDTYEMVIAPDSYNVPLSLVMRIN